MYGPRLCNKYNKGLDAFINFVNNKGLDAFINFVNKDMLNNVKGNLCCPCKHCKNEKKYHTNDVLRSHLFKHGFIEDY
jgi:hypothetical protein